MRFSSDICLLPFSHPVRLAEDLAVLDNLSGGRIEIGVGMGYAPGSKGDAMWAGAWGTSFWVDRKEGLVGILMSQAP